MKQKIDKCGYCEKEVKPKTTRAKFCSSKCRVYWNRENIKVVVTDTTKPTTVKKTFEQPKTNFTVDTAKDELPQLRVDLFEIMNRTPTTELGKRAKQFEEKRLRDRISLFE